MIETIPPRDRRMLDINTPSSLYMLGQTQFGHGATVLSMMSVEFSTVLFIAIYIDIADKYYSTLRTHVSTRITPNRRSLSCCCYYVFTLGMKPRFCSKRDPFGKTKVFSHSKGKWWRPLSNRVNPHSLTNFVRGKK